MKEFEAKVVIICITIGVIALGLGIIFNEDKQENNVIEEVQNCK